MTNDQPLKHERFLKDAIPKVTSGHTPPKTNIGIS